MNRDFHPKSAKEELKEELDDLALRQSPEPAAMPATLQGARP
jgi:hypothetical protein